MATAVQTTSQTNRPMVPSELLGRHTHTSSNGVAVNIWRRRGMFIARGSYRRQRFGKNLGETEVVAEAGLRQLLVSLDMDFPTNGGRVGETA